MAYVEGRGEMILARGKGHIPSGFDPRDRPIGALIQKLGATSSPPETFSLRPFAGIVNDQSFTSSCVGQAGTKAVLVRARVMGIPIPELSALAGYALARGLGMSPGEALVDAGSMPRNFFIAAQEVGVVAAERWPMDPATVNDKLPLDVFEAAAEAKVDAYHAIFEEGEERCQRIREAIFGGTAVCFAMPVDHAYEQLSSFDVYPGRLGPSLGGHYQIITGYGHGYFEVLGSWSLGFGQAGMVRIASSYIGNAECSDFFAIDVSPKDVT